MSEVGTRTGESIVNQAVPRVFEHSNMYGHCCCCRALPSHKGLWSEFVWMGHIEVYGKMIEECFNIAWPQSEDCKYKICEVCITQLRNALQFRRCIEKSHTALVDAVSDIKDEYAESNLDTFDHDTGHDEMVTETYIVGDNPHMDPLQDEIGVCNDTQDQDTGYKVPPSVKSESVDADVCGFDDTPLHSPSPVEQRRQEQTECAIELTEHKEVSSNDKKEKEKHTKFKVAQKCFEIEVKVSKMSDREVEQNKDIKQRGATSIGNKTVPECLNGLENSCVNNNTQNLQPSTCDSTNVNDVVVLSSNKKIKQNNNSATLNTTEVDHQDISQKLDDLLQLARIIQDNQKVLFEYVQKLERKLLMKLTHLSTQFYAYAKHPTEIQIQETNDFKQISNREQLDAFEDQLKDPVVVSTMKNKLSEVCGIGKGRGGNNAYALVDIMFTRKFMTTCSWSGGSRNLTSKICFKMYTRTFNLFFELVHESDKTYTKIECEHFFKNIMRNSAKRNKITLLRASTSRSRPKRCLPKNNITDVQNTNTQCLRSSTPDCTNIIDDVVLTSNQEIDQNHHSAIWYEAVTDNQDITQKLDHLLQLTEIIQENQNLLFQYVQSVESKLLMNIAHLSTKLDAYLRRPTYIKMQETNYFKPISNEEELDAFEDQLKDPAVVSTMKNKLSVVCGIGKGRGGNNAYALVDIMFMRKFMTTCSWSGGSRNLTSKICFKMYTRTFNLFFDLVHESDKTYTKIECEDFFKNIMRNAAKRNKIKLLRASTSRSKPKSCLPKNNITDTQNTNSQSFTSDSTNINDDVVLISNQEINHNHTMAGLDTTAEIDHQDILQKLNNLLQIIKIIQENQTLLFEYMQSVENNLLMNIAHLSTQLDTHVRGPTDIKIQETNDFKQISNREELDAFEDQLKDPAVVSIMKNKLAVVCGIGKGRGGNNAYALVDIMFTRKFMTTCSWAGGSRKLMSKICFKMYTRTFNLFFELVHESDKTYTKMECEIFFKNIMRRAEIRNKMKLRASSSKCRPKHLLKNDFSDTQHTCAQNLQPSKSDTTNSKDIVVLTSNKKKDQNRHSAISHTTEIDHDDILKKLDNMLQIAGIIRENQTLLFEYVQNVESKLLINIAHLSTQLDAYIVHMRTTDKPCTTEIKIQETNDFKPISTKEELDAFEDQLKDPALVSTMKNKLSVVCGIGKGRGGNNAYALVDIMFTRKFMTTCSWSGGSRKLTSKICFKMYTRTFNLFFELVHESDKAYTRLECQNFFKNIMRNAEARNKVKLLRASTSKCRRKRSMPKNNITDTQVAALENCADV